MSAGPDRIYSSEACTKNEPYIIFVPIQNKVWKVGPHVSNPDIFKGSEWFTGRVDDIGYILLEPIHGIKETFIAREQGRYA